MAGLVELWLRAFGPGTATDIKWWLGSTVAAVRGALADLHAVEVDLEDIGSEGSRALEHEAVRLTERLGGTRVLPRFPSPLWKAVTGTAGDLSLSASRRSPPNVTGGALPPHEAK